MDEDVPPCSIRHPSSPWYLARAGQHEAEPELLPPASQELHAPIQSTLCSARCAIELHIEEDQVLLKSIFIFFPPGTTDERLPGEVGDAPFLETFQARLDRALSNTMWLKMSLLTAGGVD